MPSYSEIILDETTHPGDSNTETVTGEKFKGDGYYGRSDGLHSVQYSYSDLIGTIKIQATLAVNPEETDWFTVHTHEVTSATSSKIASFTGNYVWIRAKIIYTAGTVQSVVLNH